MDIQRHIQQLREDINRHNIRYYVHDDPVVSDAEYDVLLRKLESLEQEAANVRTQTERLDTELSELSVQVEDSQTKCTEMEKQLTEDRAAWEIRQAELTELLARLLSEREGIASQRSDLAATLDPAGVQQYEKLRNAKGGLAVAKVERGLCQACRMSLPTQQQQRVRSGRYTVLCASCGRMLFLN